MPGVYKLKECPTCKKEHRKKGKFCSQSCANSLIQLGREHTEETKQRITQKVIEYTMTPEGVATATKTSRLNTKRAEINQKIKEGHYILEPEDYAIDIPTLDEDDDGFRL